MATETEMRIENEQAQAKQMEKARRENRDFKQVYPRGFWRIQELIKSAPQAPSCTSGWPRTWEQPGPWWRAGN